MDKKNLIKAASIVLCAAILFGSITFLMTQSRNKDNEPSATGGNSYITDQGDVIAPEGYDLLPQDSVGNWEISEDAHIFQSPRNAQMSEEDALAAEHNASVILTYVNYSTSRTSELWSPLYKVETNCDLSELDNEGIQSDGIQAELGDDLSITKIKVFCSDGVTIADTIFVVNDAIMIYYGTGDYVFAAYKVEAVG